MYVFYARSHYLITLSYLHYVKQYEISFPENFLYTKQSENITRRVANKIRAIKQFDCRCHDCQSMFNQMAVYDFHHLDPDKKSSRLTNLLDKIWGTKIEEELDKCVLLCANCHRIGHHPLPE